MSHRRTPQNPDDPRIHLFSDMSHHLTCNGSGVSSGIGSAAVLAQFFGQSGPVSEELLLGEGSGFAMLAVEDFLKALLLFLAELHPFAEAVPDVVVDESVMLGRVFATAPLGLDVLLHVAETAGFAVLAEVEAVGGEFLGESPSGKDGAQQTQQDSGGSSEANMQHGVKVLAEMCRCRGTVKTLPWTGAALGQASLEPQKQGGTGGLP